MSQFTIADLHRDAARLGLAPLAGPRDDRTIERVELLPLESIDQAGPGVLVVVPDEQQPAPFRVDVALRRAGARRIAGIVFAAPTVLAETAQLLADRGGVPVLVSTGPRPADLVRSIDRILTGGASEAVIRGAQAVEAAGSAAAAPDSTTATVLAAASTALGTALRLVEDAAADWAAADVVCIGEVPVGRVVAAAEDAATAVTVPVVASLLSRIAQRQSRERYASTRSRADLLVELVLAEASRVEGFIGPAAQLGLPLQLSHVAAWISPSHPADPGGRAPRGVRAALELFALQLVEARDELWHVAFLQDDLMLVCSEEVSAGDHQRRVREVAMAVQQHADELVGDGWTHTVGLGTPQLGPLGLRQSAAEARIAAESAIAAGRAGGVETTDVTGLRRVLLDVYASPISRDLLHDVLRPLDALGPERAQTSVRTLLAYLSHERSLVQTGRELTLHPNGVGYRMRRIRELLEVDLDDPEVRFAVELACRVRMLGTEPTSHR